ncbi:MAG: PhzF family phenazine biosynthesis protein [Deltaproteobacteria bacterium]|nr:PhzF family phenazine biosynthesis protein [Deltaproteobacteria bacterium]
MKAKLVDVFAEGKLTGNGLTIFWNCTDLSSDDMQALTQEMRQFESVFVQGEPEGNTVRARIFTMEEELDFAGHPLIGLAAHLHEEYGTKDTHQWIIELTSRHVHLVSYSRGDHYSAEMKQGAPEFISVLDQSARDEILSALNIRNSDTANLPCEVISTGLPYLIVPVTHGIERARILTTDFESLLYRHGAKFVYVLDVHSFEGRTWDNEGNVEDIATGSAAGPAAAFLCKAGLVSGNTSFHIRQGRMFGRPSNIGVFIETNEGTITDIVVRGDIHTVASISF